MQSTRDRLSIVSGVNQAFGSSSHKSRTQSSDHIAVRIKDSNVGVRRYASRAGCTKNAVANDAVSANAAML